MDLVPDVALTLAAGAFCLGVLLPLLLLAASLALAFGGLPAVD